MHKFNEMLFLHLHPILSKDGNFFLGYGYMLMKEKSQHLANALFSGI